MDYPPPTTFEPTYGHFVRAPPAESPPPVPPIQRFDLEQANPLSAEELNRRWAHFHRMQHARSPSLLRRIGGPLLGEDTARQRAIRRVLMPWLTRRKRGEPSSVFIGDGPRPFPSNYSVEQEPTAPRRLTREERREVLVLVMNEGQASHEALVETINESLRSSTSTWVMLVDSTTTGDQRDVALENLLPRVAPGIDVVFADEPGPVPSTPVLKPAAVGPHTLVSYNVVGRPALIRSSTLQRVGGFSADVGWAFEHDAYLRIQEDGGRFLHVPKVLDAGRPNVAFESEHINDGTLAATRAAMQRRGWDGTAESASIAGVSRWTVAPPSPLPSIDIVIPTRDRIDLVRRCIQSIERSTYPNYGIIIVDNDSIQPETTEFLESTRHQIVRSPGDFNYAKIVNEGVENSGADFVVTLNNDTFVLSTDWLETMVGLASLEDVGIVGVCLLDRTGHHEHDGFVAAPYPQHLRLGMNYPVADQFSAATRDVIAVTGAAQMVRRSLWHHLGGMDEQLKVVMNDVDLCLRSELEGRHTVFCPDVEIFHYAGSSRGDLDPIEDRNLFIGRWDIFGTFQDPYFAESLELIGDHFIYRY